MERVRRYLSVLDSASPEEAPLSPATVFLETCLRGGGLGGDRNRCIDKVKINEWRLGNGRGLTHEQNGK